ncbi:MAG: phenylalanine--tRNA ligase subunit alpha [bacterium]|nr:phenylalanine--tRNA ligase subunit alpha [bacterium]
MTPNAQDWARYENRIASASDVELAEIEQELFGRKNGVLTLALKELSSLDGDARSAKAKELNIQKKTLAEAITTKKSDLLSSTDGAFDVTMSLPEAERGHLHLIPEFIREVEEVFGRMGFDVFRSAEIEDEEYNFDLLNFPKDHAARDAQDVFFIKSDAPADNKLLLRAHTSPGQIRYMQSNKPPFRAIFPGKVFRKDADATHSPMFHQFEGLMIGKDISLANMKGVMITAIKELISHDAEFRCRTGYFPFTEPSMEMDMRWQGDDDSSREGKWMEIVGCGMTHPNVLRNCGINPDEWQGFAFGFGVERMIMIKHQIPDLRSLFQGDRRFLKQF